MAADIIQTIRPFRLRFTWYWKVLVLNSMICQIRYILKEVSYTAAARLRLWITRLACRELTAHSKKRLLGYTFK